MKTRVQEVTERGRLADREWRRDNHYIKRGEPGRVCEFDDCDTVLSVYNGTRFCSIHSQVKQTLERDNEIIRLANEEYRDPWWIADHFRITLSLVRTVLRRAKTSVA